MVPLIVIVVQLIKQAIPCDLWQGPGANARGVVLTFTVGLSMALLAWWLRYLPDWVTWRDAVRTGLTNSLAAAGGYSMIKSLLNPDPPVPTAPTVAAKAASKKAATP